MLDQILSSTKKQTQDYLTVLTLSTLNRPMTAEETNEMVDIYAKYLSNPGNDQDYPKICLAIDLMATHGLEDVDYFAPLGLCERDINALLLIKTYCAGTKDYTGELAGEIVETVYDEEVCLALRITLARIALDAMTVPKWHSHVIEPITQLAKFLIACGEEQLECYIALIGDVKEKCRQ